MSDDIASLEEAVRALPDNTPLRRQLAEALAHAGRSHEALVHWEALCARRPDDARARLALARALYDVGRYGDALARYDEAVARDAGLADARLREELARAALDPRARLRVVAAGPSETDELPSSTRAPGGGERVTFADVGGLDDVKEKIRLRLLYPLKRPDVYAAYGKRAGGGLLLYGPPGCGKTFLARATAGEAGIPFVGVGIDEVLDMWLGQSEKKLHQFFADARGKAPAVLFFDEVDALGGRRSALRHESYRTLVTQFLAELDGAGDRRHEGVLVVGATNAPWDVDPAFRRPGRFGDVLFVPPPDLRARVEILKLKLSGKPQKDIDVTEIARRTELYSGADLANVVDAACEEALAHALAGGPGLGAVRPLTTDDLVKAQARVKASTREWFASARNFAEHANVGGQYDDVVAFLQRHRLV